MRSMHVSVRNISDVYSMEMSWKPEGRVNLAFRRGGLCIAQRSSSKRMAYESGNGVSGRVY